MYTLQNNVYVISGKKRYCIYDLNTRKIYSLDSEHGSFLEKFIGSKTTTGDIPQSAKDYFIKSGIAVKKENLVPQLHDHVYKPSIEFAWIEVTQNCNLLCRHCYENSSKILCRSEMKIEDFKYVINCLQSYGIEKIQLVGGEPLCHKDIMQMVKYAAGKLSKIEIFTNGTLLTDELLSIVKKYDISLACSIYSESEMIHDYVTLTEGSLKLTHKNIEDALKRGISVRVASIEMKNVPKFHFTHLKVAHRTDLPRLTGRAGLSLYSKDMLKKKLITKKSFKNPINPESFFKNQRMHNCFGQRVYVDTNLNVFPCAMERRVSYGNLRQKDIKEIYNNDLVLLNKDKVNGCKDCEFRYACYDCRADSNNALIDSKPWYCTYNQDEGIWIDEEIFIDTLLSEQ